ncbi:hypothetical protein PAXRUDRAFT_163165, partial [Paxillus rubicundulus Ve08.2h10]
CVTGLSSQHVAERFQHSPDTITRYLKCMLFFFASTPFYTSQVCFPTHQSPISAIITNNSCFQAFRDFVGAVDGTYIRAFAPLEEHPHMRNHKGYISQNCLFVCEFDFFSTLKRYKVPS